MDEWDKLPAETSKAFDAFHAYLLCPKPRSIDAAYFRAHPQPNNIGKRAAWQWWRWSVAHEWVKRVTAYDAHLLKQDELLWEERRRRKKEREWTEAEQIRDVLEEAIPHARQFIRHKTAYVRGENGAPDREIITVEFDIVGLATVAEKMQRIQNLVLGDATENVNLSGAALNALLASEFARVAYGREATGGGEVAGDADGGEEAAGAAPETA